MDDDLGKILSVRQPWAQAIVDGHKDVENRSMGFTLGYRGRLWIAATKTVSVRGLLDPKITAQQEYVKGAIIGYASVVDAHLSHPDHQCCDSEWAELTYIAADGSEKRNLVHLLLENPVKLDDPIPAKGRLGLWKPDPDLAYELHLALGGAPDA